MSNEIARLQQTSRRMMLVWLIVACCLLIYCLIGAFSDHPHLLHSWKGATLLVLSSIFALWYINWYWRFYRHHVRVQHHWPPPWRWAMRRHRQKSCLQHPHQTTRRQSHPGGKTGPRARADLASKALSIRFARR